MEKNIIINNFKESELYIVIPLISEIIKDNKKKIYRKTKKSWNRTFL